MIIHYSIILLSDKIYYEPSFRTILNYYKFKSANKGVIKMYNNI